VTALVVLAHPRPESYVSAVFESAQRGLRAGGATAEIADLYADEYQPGTALPVAHRVALDKASTLVLVYPTWWTSQPAILLGWLYAAATEGLASVKSLVCITTHGGPRKGNLVAGQSGRHTAARTVRAACAPGASFHWVAYYGMDKDLNDERVAFLQRVEHEMRKLALLAP